MFQPKFYGIFVVIIVCGQAVFAQSVCKGNDIFLSRTCAGDTNSPDERALFQMINKYRAANGQPELRPSTSLGMLANRRILDMQQNMKMLTHSWSNCPYEIKDEKTWPCVLDAPKKFNTGYNGQGYETLYRTQTGQASPSAAIEAWKKSPLHNSIILNLGIFKELPWNEVGVAVDGQYAVLWFGNPGNGGKVADTSGGGLGVSYDKSVAGLSKLLSIEQASSTYENNKWRGLSPDKKIKLEIYGTKKEINEANLGITIKLDPNGKLDTKSQTVLATLFKNLFPEWPNPETWIDSSVNAISLNRTASRTKLVRKIAIEMYADGTNAIKVTIAPETRPKAVEVF